MQRTDGSIPQYEVVPFTEGSFQMLRLWYSIKIFKPQRKLKQSFILISSGVRPAAPGD